MKHSKPTHQGIYVTKTNKYRVNVYNKLRKYDKTLPLHIYVGTFDTLDQAITAKQDKINEINQLLK